MTDAKDVHPLAADGVFCLFGLGIKSNRVLQPTCHDTDGGDVLTIAAVHLWRHVADMLLDVPDAVATASLVSEECDVAGIALWIVGTDE